MMGYRTEQLRGENYRDAASVMAHEVFILQNVDIPDTLCDGILKESRIIDELERLRSRVANRRIVNGDVEMDKLCNIASIFRYESVGVGYFNKVLGEIELETGKNIKYALWLCDSIDDVVNEYGEFGNITEFDQYETSDIILSDIGRAGKLYGYEECPMYKNRIIAK